MLYWYDKRSKYFKLKHSFIHVCILYLKKNASCTSSGFRKFTKLYLSSFTFLNRGHVHNSPPKLHHNRMNGIGMREGQSMIIHVDKYNTIRIDYILLQFEVGMLNTYIFIIKKLYKMSFITTLPLHSPFHFTLVYDLCNIYFVISLQVTQH